MHINDFHIKLISFNKVWETKIKWNWNIVGEPFTKKSYDVFEKQDQIFPTLSRSCATYHKNASILDLFIVNIKMSMQDFQTPCSTEHIILRYKQGLLFVLYVICKVSDLVNFYLWIIACGYVNALKSSYHICGTQIYINTKIHINRSSNEININKFHTDSAFCRSRLRFA